MTGLRALFDYGVKEGMRGARASTLRALNVILAVLSLIALFAAIVSGVQVSAELALVNVVFLLCYVVAILLNGGGHHEAARYVTTTVGGANFFLAEIALGNQAGMDFYAVAIVLAPLMVFTRAENGKLALTFAWLAASVVAAKIYLAYWPPLFQAPDSALATARISALVMVCFFTATTVYRYRATAIRAQVDLYKSNQRLHELLTNTLPGLIADRLQRGETLIADSHAEATVLFADLVGFSELSQRLSPTHLVELLNNLFSQFDEAAVRHRVEKIKTIGDCYMAATGVLGEGAGRVEAMADFALDMLEIIHAVRERTGLPLELRIGISTGPVISGVIGRHKYAYDLWGDTVNLASRMESGGERGRIQVNEATYWRLRPRYRLEKRGEINFKGHPNTMVYDLLGAIEPSQPPNVVPIETRALRL